MRVQFPLSAQNTSLLIYLYFLPSYLTDYEFSYEVERIVKMKSKSPKPRDPSSVLMQALRKSGAAGSHQNKKERVGRKAKHKKQAGVAQR